MNKRLLVGNWKMYIERPEEARKFAKALRRKARAFAGVEVMLAPSFTLLSPVAEALKGSSIGVAAQALASQNDPKHTGEVSAAMLRGAGVSAVIVGHSERRAAGESNEAVAAQLLHAQGAGLTPILCVGEVERDQGGAYLTVVAEQLRSALAGRQGTRQKLVVAYEPVWAIGKTAEHALSPAELTEMVIFIKKTLADVLGRPAALKVPILYGGSVEGSNAETLIAEGGVSGFLVGHASAVLDSFVQIITACK